MFYYVVYREKEIVQGPMSQIDAECLAEDLDFALEDKGYQVIPQDRLAQLNLLPDLMPSDV